jgi:hypothetical protein
MRIFLTSRPLSAADLGRAALTGVVAGTTSAAWRWLIFRHEAKRRTKRLQDTLTEAADSFGAAITKATGRVGTPAPPKVEPSLGGVTVLGPASSPEELNRIFEDLAKVRRDLDGS